MFFLAGLAIALLGFSATLYLIVRNHLYGQFESRLGNALRILSAAVEVELDDAKWQPAEFSIDLAESEGITWFVTNEQGQLLDHSSSFSRQDSDELALFKFAANNHRDPMLDQMIGPWRVLQKQLAAFDVALHGRGMQWCPPILGVWLQGDSNDEDDELLKIF